MSRIQESYCDRKSRLLWEIYVGKTQRCIFHQNFLFSSHRTPYGLWRRILEETEAAAKTRMNVSQKLLTNVTESVKTLKPERVAIVKQVIHYCWARAYDWFDWFVWSRLQIAVLKKEGLDHLFCISCTLTHIANLKFVVNQ